MRLAPNFLLWALAWQAVAGFNKKDTVAGSSSGRDLAVELPPVADYLIYSPTLASTDITNAITALGSTYSAADADQFNAMTTDDFKKYKAIVFADPRCSNLDVIAGAMDSRAAWSAAVTGNVIVIGSDEVYHWQEGGKALATNGLKFVVAPDPAEPDNIKTGLYFSLGCYYWGASPSTSVAILDKIGEFTVDQVPTCYNDLHVVATHPVTESLTDSVLENMYCSVHLVLTSYPANYIPLVIAQNVGTMLFADGSVGTPYIIIRGGSPVGCGNGIKEPPEECDDGNLVNGDGCTQICKFDKCGDGLPGLGEQCDDGNTVDGDECSATCQNEPVCPPTDFCCGKPDGTKCNMGDGNKCLKNSKCMANKCEPGPLKVCNPPTQCKNVVGGCDTATGFCTFALKPDGTVCNDGKATTKNDQCVKGFCVGTPI